MLLPPIRSRLFLISLLGALSVISPFSIDMYLPAFGEVAKDFGVPSTAISLTLSSYFIGMALGQIFYGPLLDRFGRKRPIYFGLGLYVLISIACTQVASIDMLIGLRALQAFGGCVAGVASLAMTRDFFGRDEAAKIMSRLFLFIAISPILAPTTGGMLALAFGWRSVFWLLAAIVVAILALLYFLLPEGHQPDPGISLKPGPIIREYLAILKQPRFHTYAFAGAFAFAGLFTYVAGSPIVFMDGFRVTPHFYSGIFAAIAVGFIGCSQLNIILLKRYTSEQMFLRMITLQAITGIVFAVGAWYGWWNLYVTILFFLVFLSCAGMSYPNAAALALSPFTQNIGSASALLGFLQLGTGALISTGIGAAAAHGSFPIIAIMGATAVVGWVIVMTGARRAHTGPVVA